MIFVLLTVLSSLGIVVILHYNERRTGDRLVVAGSNYVVASILGLLLSDLAEPEPAALGFGVVVGAGFVAGFLVLMRAMRRSGLGVPASVARLSMVVPVVGSILVYGEMPQTLQWLGIVLGIVAFIVLGAAQMLRRPGVSLAGAGSADAGLGGIADATVDHRGTLLLAAVFVVIGLNDFSMKVAGESGIDTDGFLFYLFTTAALLCWAVIVVRRRRPKRHELAVGALLGVPNFFSSYFLLHALDRLPAGVVYPVVSAGGVVAASIAGLLLWRERHSPLGWIGIGLAAIAVALVSGCAGRTAL